MHIYTHTYICTYIDNRFSLGEGHLKIQDGTFPAKHQQQGLVLTDSKDHPFLLAPAFSCHE